MLLLSALPSQPVMIGGDERQKKWIGEGIASGSMKGAFCLTEPNHGSDAGNLETRAVARRRRLHPQRREDVHLRRHRRRLRRRVRAHERHARPEGHQRASSCRPTRPASASPGRTARWASAACRRPTSCSRTAACRARTSSAASRAQGFNHAMLTLNSCRPVVGARGARPRRGRDDVRAGVRAQARGVRQADRRPAGDPVHVRRHGDPDRSGAPARLPGRVARRPGAVRPRARRLPVDREGATRRKSASRCRATRCRCSARRAT